MKIPEPVERCGKWRVQITVNGVRSSRSFGTREEALMWAMQLKLNEQTAVRTPCKMQLKDAVERYIVSKDCVLSPSTIRGYRSMQKVMFPDLMKLRLESITQEDVQKAVNKMARDKSPKTVRNAHGFLSTVMQQYRKDFILKTTLPQKQKHEIQIPTKEEVEAIAKDVKGKNFELPFLLAAHMGMRTSEIRGLTWDCIKGNKLHIKQAMVADENEKDVIKNTKTLASDRWLTIPPRILALIEEKRKTKTDNFVIHYTRTGLYNRLNDSCKRLGFQHYRFHDLRHYYASVLLALNVPDKYAMKLTGHSTPNMLKTTYQHLMREKEEEITDLVTQYFAG